MLLNRAKALTATATIGTVTLGAAVSPFQTWAAALPLDGGTYSYLIEDGTAWELGRGVYAAGAGTLTRPGPGVDSTFASSSGALLMLSGGASVACVANEADFAAMGGSGGSGGGAMVLLETVNAAGLADIVFTGLSSQYLTYIIEAVDIVPANTGGTLQMQVSTDGGATFDTGANYDNALWIVGSGGYTATFGGNAQGFLTVGNGPTNTNQSADNTTVKLFNPAGTSNYKGFWTENVCNSNDGNIYQTAGGGRWRNAGAYDAVKIAPSAGGFTSGTFRIYGLGGNTAAWDFDPPLAASLVLASGDGNAATITDGVNVGLIFEGGTLSGGLLLRMGYVAIPTPTSDWTFTTKIRALIDPANFSAFVPIVVYDPGSGKAQSLNLAQDGSLEIDNWTNLGTRTSFTALFRPGAPPAWFRVQSISGALHFAASADGEVWLPVFTAASGSFLAANPGAVGFGVVPDRTTGLPLNFSVPYARLTQP